MKKILTITFTILLFSFAAIAQDVQMSVPDVPPKRPNLLQALGLSTEQVQQIKKINKEQKPKMDSAQRNLRQTKKALDDSVYSEIIDDADIQAKIKAFQTAQIEVTGIKAETEVSIRKVLTTEQLVKFRELRIRLMQAIKQPNRPILNNLKRFPNRQQ
jgi:Spy/CpxP family protein refolding chaperone